MLNTLSYLGTPKPATPPKAYAFTVKIFKHGKLHRKYKGIAPSSADLFDSALKRHFPCGVTVMCDQNIQQTGAKQ